jgi:RNA polymerase sigma-70 factor (ECF subfamily)
MKAEITAQLATRQKQFLSFLQPRLGDRAAAEDVLQAAYLQAAEKADTIRDDESSVAWFYRLLRNAVADVRGGSHESTAFLPRASSTARAATSRS